MFPSPTGLTPVDGITMRAQTILHREILHLHGLLILLPLTAYQTYREIRQFS